MKSIWLTLAAITCVAGAFAQPKQDKEAIKGMCGCFKINFDYKETFATDTAYEFRDSYHTSAPAEWAFVAEETDDRIVIQHLLVIQDSIVIKHWRQDWIYQANEHHHYYKDNTWKYSKTPAQEVKGQWTQNVYQVDDSPRYAGSATWVHVDGKHYWESTTDAPLPRREYSKRSDYNVMERTNRHIMTDYGWLHEQNNRKIVRSEEGDKVLVEERGLNKYVKIEDAKCQAAIDWWNEHEAYWKLVRDSWDEIYAKGDDLKITKKVNNKMLWQALFALGKEESANVTTDAPAVRKKINNVINTYLVQEDKADAGTY